jgi:hypothetical protein
MDEKKDCTNPNCACDGPCSCGNTCTCVKAKEGAVGGCDNEYCKVRNQNEIDINHTHFVSNLISLSVPLSLSTSPSFRNNWFNYSVPSVDVAKDAFAMFQALRTNK